MQLKAYKVFILKDYQSQIVVNNHKLAPVIFRFLNGMCTTLEKVEWICTVSLRLVE